MACSPASSQHSGTRSTQSQWHLLPPLFLSRVFSFLDRNERKDAGSVCRPWRQVFLLPMFWRHRAFWCCEGSTSEKAAQYMERFGRHLRDMYLVILAYKVKVMRKISLGVKALLEAQTHGMQLRKLTCRSLGGFKNPRHHRVNSRIINAVCDFISKQTCLENVDLKRNFVAVEIGARILRALASHNAEPRSTTDLPATLTYLNLCHFFAYEATTEDFSTHLEDIGSFRALRILIIDFISLGEKLLEKLSLGSPCLEVVGLTIEEINFKLLSPSSAGWQAAVRRCPELKVCLRLYGDVYDFQQVLVPGMPMISLSWYTYRERRADFAGFFQHVHDNFASTIQLIHLDPFGLTITPRVWTPPRGLVDLVAGCRSLTCLSVACRLHPETLLQVAAVTCQCSASSQNQKQPLQIHLGKNNSNVLGNRILQRLSTINPFCSVEICRAEDCSPHLYKAQMEHC